MPAGPTTSVSVPRRPWIFWAGLVVLLLGAMTLFAASLANGPNLELTFTRDVPSSQDPATLATALDQLKDWPAWFFSTTDAEMVDEHGQVVKNATISPGAFIRLGIEPKKMKSRRFEVVLRVLEYARGKKIRLKVISDSKNILTRLFDDLEWTVELDRQGATTMIHGTAIAHTANWRSRLFGRIASRTLMNQVYYPDLMTLGRFTGEPGVGNLFPDG